MQTLILAQTIFYFAMSIALVTFSMLLAIMAYRLMYITKSVKNIFEDFGNIVQFIKEKIKETSEKLSDLPFLSFLKKKTRKEETKSRADL